jgi:hypothetical protein
VTAGGLTLLPISKGCSSGRRQGGAKPKISENEDKEVDTDGQQEDNISLEDRKGQLGGGAEGEY